MSGLALSCVLMNIGIMERTNVNLVAMSGDVSETIFRKVWMGNWDSCYRRHVCLCGNWNIQATEAVGNQTRSAIHLFTAVWYEL